MGWLFVPGAADLKPHSTSCSQNIAPFVLSKGKLTPQPPSWPGWKKRGWARVLCGMTLPPSTLCRGVDSWISSLRDTRASHSATPENAREKMTLAISGLLSSGIFALLCPPSSFVKTSQLTLPGVSMPSGETLSELATRLRLESSARRKLARHIFESGFSFSDNWRTPNCTDSKDGTRTGQGQVQLCYQVRELFPTPTANGNHNRKGVSQKAGDGLATAAASWPTPKASDGPKGGPNQRGSKGDLALPAAVQEWATPTASIATGGQTSRGGARKEELLLSGQAAQNWGTPSAHDAKGKGLDGQLVTDVLHGRGQQDAEPSSTPGKSPGLLNPAWVEQLMGWAPGQSSFSASATEWCRWLALWRSWLFGGS